METRPMIRSMLTFAAAPFIAALVVCPALALTTQTLDLGGAGANFTIPEQQMERFTTPERSLSPERLAPPSSPARSNGFQFNLSRPGDDARDFDRQFLSPPLMRRSGDPYRR